MHSDKLIFAATCDLAGLVRGKAFPATDLAKRSVTGVGYAYSNIMLSPFGPIYKTPFGTQGDLKLVPDPQTRAHIPGEHGMSNTLMLGDICHTEDGSAWECCPRAFLKRALAQLEAEYGLCLRAAFEQEFIYTGVEEGASASYTFDLYRRSGPLGADILAALEGAGIVPDSFLPEAGDRQFEVTVKPHDGLAVADQAVILREIIRGCAAKNGYRASLSPVVSVEGMGNGTHVHFSFVDRAGNPQTYDPDGFWGLSAFAASFLAGVVEHMPALTALTTPSVASYYRLRPGKWAPTWANVGFRDRGASLRICPTFSQDSREIAKQYNIEYRVADATASPYLALGCIVYAGLEGVRKKRALLQHPQGNDARLQTAGIKRLPTSLGAALDCLEKDTCAHDWFGSTFLNAYVMFKRSEIEALDGFSEKEICDRYMSVY